MSQQNNTERKSMSNHNIAKTIIANTCKPLFVTPLFVTSDPKTELILQDINTLKEQYPQASTVIRSLDHMSKSNNWLKMHNKPMRRKPLKRTYLIFDEFSNI